MGCFTIFGVKLRSDQKDFEGSKNVFKGLAKVAQWYELSTAAKGGRVCWLLPRGNFSKKNQYPGIFIRSETHKHFQTSSSELLRVF